MEIPQWGSTDLQEKMKQGLDIQIIDVRQPEEFSSGHIPGAKLIPLGELAARYQEIRPDVESAIVCRSGGRSMKACELLSNYGYKKIHNLSGGMLAWDGDVE
jgi:rhodanese-related sulfurtransferase